MTKLVLDEKKVRVQGVDWYRGDNFAGAEKVTANQSNEALGIENISLFKRSDEGAYASANIRFTNGVVIRGTVWYTKDQGHLRLGFYQTKSEKDNEWYPQEVMTFPLELQAQVLRYAEACGTTQAVPVSAPIAPAVTQPVAPVAQVTPAQEAVQMVAQEPAQESKRIFNPEDMSQLTEEQILALLNN